MPKAANLFDYRAIAGALITIGYTALNSFDYSDRPLGSRAGRWLALATHAETGPRGPHPGSDRRDTRRSLRIHRVGRQPPKSARSWYFAYGANRSSTLSDERGTDDVGGLLGQEIGVDRGRMPWIFELKIQAIEPVKTPRKLHRHLFAGDKLQQLAVLDLVFEPGTILRKPFSDALRNASRAFRAGKDLQQ